MEPGRAGADAAGARRLAAIGDLWALRAPDDDVEKRYWAIDGYSGLVVEVAAALGVSRKRAQAQVDRAVMLRTRLPKVAEVYAKGLIDAVMVAMIVSRTDLIIDDDVAQQVEDLDGTCGVDQVRRRGDLRTRGSALQIGTGIGRRRIELQ